MDFEEQLDLFFIRKETELIPHTEPRAVLIKNRNSKQTNNSKDVYNCIPLMLKNIQNLNENSFTKGTNVIKAFSDKVLFKRCLVYGKIMSKVKESNSSYKYILDDGTASLDITIFRRAQDLETVMKLENELQAVKREMLAQNKNEIVNSLRNLLFKIKEQIDHSNVTVGSKVLLYGKPNFFEGEMSLNVYSLMEDSKSNSDIEIAFKDYLIEWYKQKFLFSTNSS